MWMNQENNNRHSDFEIKVYAYYLISLNKTSYLFNKENFNKMSCHDMIKFNKILGSVFLTT